MKNFTRLVTGFLVLGLSTSASAQLVSRLGGQAVYDIDLDVTWLADANYAKSSGFSSSGAMPLFLADQFIAKLNIDSVGGVNDWRLPVADPACGVTFHCSNSEMGHLFYDELGGTATESILTSTDPDLALFSNIQQGDYWTGTPVSANSRQWVFDFDNGGSSGLQNQGPPSLNKWVWAVRSGDLPPMPPALTGDVASISLLAGGQQVLTLDAGALHAGWFYWVLGSATGTTPGLSIGGLLALPLNFDGYFKLTLLNSGLGPFGNFRGQLDAAGMATATLTVPPGVDPTLAGVTLNHAFLGAEVSGVHDLVSNAVPVTFVP
jgi:hypothetical protein